MSISAKIENVNVTIRGLEQASLDVREAAFQGVLLGLNAAFKECATTISADDHSLRELALMGHPYGFTHPAVIHDPDVIVHIQSGTYLGHLQRTSPSGAGGDIIEGKIYNDSPMDEWIQNGTSRMRGRPWMQWVVEHYGEDFATIIEARIRRALKAA